MKKKSPIEKCEKRLAADIIAETINRERAGAPTTPAKLAASHQLPGYCTYPLARENGADAAYNLPTTPEPHATNEQLCDPFDPMTLSAADSNIRQENWEEHAPWLADTPEEKAAAEHEANRLKGPASFMNRVLRASGLR